MKLSSLDVELIEQWWVVKSRTSFYHYRQFLNYPSFKKGWFPSDLSIQLQQFYNDMVAGLRPILIIEAPPQHGKSTAIIDFISWYMGRVSEIRIIYGTFSERLGIRANRNLQRIFDGRKHKLIFPEFSIGDKRVVTTSNNLLKNNTIVETNGGGYFRNTTVGGSVTGESLDLGVVDDPIKGRKAANSKITRDTAWDWLTDDFMTRFSEYAGLLIINTRWHIDDPAGVFAEVFRNVPEERIDAVADNKTKDRVRKAPGHIDDKLEPAFESGQGIDPEDAGLQTVAKAEQGRPQCRPIERHR